MKLTGIRGLFFVCAGVCGLVAMSGCRKRDPTGPVAAQVGNYKITVGDLQARLRETPASYQQYVATAEGRRQFLDLLIREKVLLSEAKTLGIPRDPAYKAAVDKFKTEWSRRLQEYEDTLQVESALRRLRAGDLAATDTDVEKYYNDHRADFEKPLEIQTSHILLGTEEEARTALARLGAGDSFEQVARALSRDPATAVHGGKMAPFRRGMLVPEFEDAAFALKVGQVSGIVKSQFGFHIIRKTGEKRLPAKTLADVKEEVRSLLERAKFNQWVAAKQSALGVKVNENAMQLLAVEESPKP